MTDRKGWLASEAVEAWPEWMREGEPAGTQEVPRDLIGRIKSVKWELRQRYDDEKLKELYRLIDLL